MARERHIKSQKQYFRLRQEQMSRNRKGFTHLGAGRRPLGLEGSEEENEES